MRTTLCCGVVVSFAVLGCKPADKRPSPFPEIDPPPAPVAILSGQPPASTSAWSRDHALRGTDVRDAVMRGDLARARTAAKSLADLPVEAALRSPPRSTRLEAMVLAARTTGDAGELGEAARSLAALGASCGACHAVTGGVPTRAVAPPPPDEPDRVSHMLRHQWGAARLWEGLAAPSEDAWRSGAVVLSDAPLPAGRLTPGKTPVAALDRLTVSVHELGRKATKAAETNERVETYGALMATCASCHEWLETGPREPKR